MANSLSPHNQCAIPPRPTLGVELATGAACALVAALLAFRHMVTGGFSRVPGTVEDGRLTGLFLEHTWGWLAGARGHESLWGLPAFFPAGDNAVAFSDSMLSFGPLYWPWRLLGFAPDTSYQLWLSSALAASFLAVHLFLRWVVGGSRSAAALGAWLAVCSASRLHQIGHAQLLPLFFVVAALAGAIAWVRAETPARSRIGAVIAVAALVAQCYGGVYFALFAGFAMAVLGAVGLTLSETRRRMLERLRRDWPLLVGLGIAGALALAPWIRHYSDANELVGGRRWEELAPMLPRLQSWLFVSPKAWAYGWTTRSALFGGLPWRFEHAVGLGFFTTALTAWAIVAGRRQTAVRLASAVALVLIAITTILPGGFTLWRWVVEITPPLAAARAVVRIGLLLPLAAAVILVTAVARAQSRLARTILLVVLALAGVEQLGRFDSYNKETQRVWVDELASRIDPHARAFVVTRTERYPPATVLHLDAMWAASLSGVPTVNGYSGNSPPQWQALRQARVRDRAQRETFREALENWLVASGAAGTPVQWIEIPPGYRGGG